MSYRSLHKANETFELVVIWLLVGAFLLAMALMFLHPTGALAIFMAALVVTAVVVVVERFIHRAERAAARRELRAGSCPGCGTALVTGGSDAETGTRRCPSCGAAFLASGEELTAGA